jgi:hypothetical protein
MLSSGMLLADKLSRRPGMNPKQPHGPPMTLGNMREC